MLNQTIFIELEAYIRENLEEITLSLSQESHLLESDYNIQETEAEIELENYIKNKRRPTLQNVLFGYIDNSGLSDPEVYKRAGIDRKHFSKIRSHENYLPKKNSLIALAFALELNRKETDNLLGSAGYSLSNSETNDLVIQFCLEKKIYNIYDVNEALDYFNLQPLVGQREA